jgi:hypothetical protein
VNLRAISYGAGVQSTAMLVLAAQGEIYYPLAIFANVGDRAEHPASLSYFRDLAMPYAEANGIELLEMRATANGKERDLYDTIMRDGSRSIGIPVRMSNGAPGRRSCTVDFKVRRIASELKRRGATADSPATVALGISIDEYQRMRPSAIAWEVFDYPLVERRMTRQDCLNLIATAGLPEPAKSSCYFCPFHSSAHWQRMRQQEPALFAKSVEIERTINVRRTALGKDAVYMTRFGKPLDEAIVVTGQMDLFDDATCDVAGYCGA